MCLILVAVDTVPGLPLLVLGNRDEFHGRASAPLACWDEAAHVAGGRDQVAGGSWLALRDDGRLAAVTNLRSGLPATAPRSRGALVRDFVTASRPAAEYLDAVAADSASFGPFNLIVADGADAWLLASGEHVARKLGAGLHVVSNGPFGAAWPKTERLRERFLALRAGTGDGELLDLLADEAQPPDAALPDTGVGLELERVLAPIFVRGERYGTRASTLALVRADGCVRIRERRFGPGGAWLGETAFEARAGAGFRPLAG